MIKNQSKNKIK